MIWGIGTGRCGTRSLARLLSGIHEPQPWLAEDSVAYAQRGEHADHLKALLRGRLALDVPAVVDLRQSYIIPLIGEVDPQAQFLWLARHPMLCIGSFLAGGSWTSRDLHGARKLSPAEGWPAGATRLEKATWFWVAVNQRIQQDLERTGAPFEVWLTHELPAQVHENHYEASWDWTWTREQAAHIQDHTATTWLHLQHLAADTCRPTPLRDRFLLSWLGQRDRVQFGQTDRGRFRSLSTARGCALGSERSPGAREPGGQAGSPEGAFQAPIG